MKRSIVGGARWHAAAWAHRNLVLFSTDSFRVNDSWLETALRSAEVLQQQALPISGDLAHRLMQECIRYEDLDLVRRVQSLMFYGELESFAKVADRLIRLFVSCKSLIDANRVFGKVKIPTHYTWNAIIVAHSKLGKCETSLEFYKQMQHVGAKIDKFTFSSILKTCGSIGCIEQGKQVHKDITDSGLESDIVVESALVDMYAKCGDMEEARIIFDKLANKNVVTWNAMIAGYAQHEQGLLALDCFENMKKEGINPDNFTFSSILKACNSIGAIDLGRQIHQQTLKNGSNLDIFVAGALIDMYIKCGNMEQAYKVFEKLPTRDVVAWGAIISGYAQCGKVDLVKQCLEGMQLDAINPNDVIFATVLAACSHAGLINEGHCYFKSMREDYGIIPDTRHYNCMIDLLARAGQLNEAEQLLLLIQPDIIPLISLLTACRVYGNVELGKRCFDRIVQLEPSNAGGHVLMSGIYSDAYMVKDAKKIEELRHRAGAWKKPARAWIEVGEKVHEFTVGDKSHPQTKEIFAMLKRLSDRMKDEGYMPKLDSVLQQMTVEDKEDALCGHCEKLAIAFGLVSTPPGTTLRARKNLRVCMDCHNATKIISKIEGREIIIRDAYRLHHMIDGICSCGDYF